MSDPVYNAFTTRDYDGKDGKKTYWTQIGKAFAHKNGKGLDIVLDALPVNGRIVLLEPKEKPDDNKQG